MIGVSMSRKRREKVVDSGARVALQSDHLATQACLAARRNIGLAKRIKTAYGSDVLGYGEICAAVLACGEHGVFRDRFDKLGREVVKFLNAVYGHENSEYARDPDGHIRECQTQRVFSHRNGK